MSKGVKTELKEVATFQGSIFHGGPWPRTCMFLDYDVPADSEPAMRRGLCHGFYVRQWTHGESPMVGGFAAGQEAEAYALVEGEDGYLRELPARRIRLLDSAQRFMGYGWPRREEPER